MNVSGIWVNNTMDLENNAPGRGTTDNLTDSNRGEQKSSTPFDLPDSPADQEKLQPEVTTINLPDVSDIPGQEQVTMPQMGEFADTTISSDDEEGVRVFGDDAPFTDDTSQTAQSNEETGRDGGTVAGTP